MTAKKEKKAQPSLVKLTVRLTVAENELLETEAQRRHVSKNFVIRELVKRAFSEQD